MVAVVSSWEAVQVEVQKAVLGCQVASLRGGLACQVAPLGAAYLVAAEVERTEEFLAEAHPGVRLREKKAWEGPVALEEVGEESFWNSLSPLKIFRHEIQIVCLLIDHLAAILVAEGEEGAYSPEDAPWKLDHLTSLIHCYPFHYLRCQVEAAG